MDSEHNKTDEYRKLHPLAVVALLLGIASLVAFASPGMWLVPLLAVCCALIALWQIHLRPEQLAGAKLARWALALAVVIGMAAISKRTITKGLLHQQAETIVEGWLSALAEKQYDKSLRFLTYKAVSTFAPPLDPRASPDTPRPTEAEAKLIVLTGLRESPLAEQTAQLGESPNAVALGPLSGTSARGATQLLPAVYRVESSITDSTGKPFTLSVVLAWNDLDEGSRLPARIDQWRILEEEPQQ
ncbi:hypothetical protein [Adhaeretor mobilis]|uniref:Uncharacterized protein n=1 Tax=Adhaeretor mobilis TaxID=1930276 RepID=A0A517N1I4_9BACT|nr:hypothetical protein [Adhaeretor mobilis]QDT00991.1 hypothetical protein HG15A2_43330 [Adhaeretor mobilis]